MTHIPSTSLSVTTLWESLGSSRVALPVPRGTILPGSKPHSSLTTARDTISTKSIPSLMSLPTDSHTFRQNHHSLVTSLSSSHRPPVWMAVGASSQMPISSHGLWQSYCRQTAWIHSQQASHYSQIQEASFSFVVPGHRPCRPLYPRITAPRPELDHSMLCHIPHPRADTHGRLHMTHDSPGLHQASSWPPHRLGASQSFSSRCKLH